MSSLKMADQSGCGVSYQNPSYKPFEGLRKKLFAGTIQDSIRLGNGSRFSEENDAGRECERMWLTLAGKPQRLGQKAGRVQGSGVERQERSEGAEVNRGAYLTLQLAKEWQHGQSWPVCLQHGLAWEWALVCPLRPVGSPPSVCTNAPGGV